MTNGDLIARLYPADDPAQYLHYAADTIKMRENKQRYVAPRLTPPVSEPLRPRPRGALARFDATPPEPAPTVNPKSYLPCLELRFSYGPRSQYGFVFGTDPLSSDIVLPDWNGISSPHCALTFENDFADGNYYRLVLRNKSQFGMAVEYGNLQGQSELRRDFRWILGGHPDAKAETTIIEITPKLKFQMVVFEHDITSHDYAVKVGRFLQGTANTDELLTHISILSQPTTIPDSEIRTPGTGPIRLPKSLLGEGAFGVVTRVWDVSTAAIYAVKKPLPTALNMGRVDIKAWEKEAKIMGKITHRNVVRLIAAIFDPMPELTLEYAPEGTLYKLHKLQTITTRECLEILHQCLSALKYLHGQNKPIVHRDIKPENVLVQSRDSSHIHVKLTDFGASRESRDLTTWCGTRRYMAPEVYDQDYTPVVDIWSLGVMIFQFLYGHPPYLRGDKGWCKDIIKKLKKDLVKNQYDDLLQFLATHMVVYKGKERTSAEGCYSLSLQLDEPHHHGGSQTPTQASFSKANKRSAKPNTVLYRGPAPSDSEANRLAAYFNSSPTSSNHTSSSHGKSRSSHGNERQSSMMPHATSGRHAPYPPQSPSTGGFGPSTESSSTSGGYSNSRSSGKRSAGSEKSDRTLRPRKATSSSRFHTGEQSNSNTSGRHASSGQYGEPEEQDYSSFHESNLLDPLHHLGGGSSLAAELGEESSQWDSIFLKQSSSSDRNAPSMQSLQGYVGSQSLVQQSRPQQPLAQDPYRQNMLITPAAGQPGYQYQSYSQGGYPVGQNQYPAYPSQQQWQGQMIEGNYVDDDTYTAASLLAGMRNNPRYR